jgi:hypothetical protein
MKNVCRRLFVSSSDDTGLQLYDLLLKESYHLSEYMFRRHWRRRYDRNRALTRNCCQKHLASSVCVCMCVCVNISRHTRQPYVCSVLETSGFAFTLAYIFSKCQTQDDARTKHLWLLLSFVPLFGPKDKHFSSWSRRGTRHIVNRRFIHPQLYLQETAQVQMEWT